jgi:ribose 5-phosphate isomerase B
MYTIAIGCDPNASHLKEVFVPNLRSLRYSVDDTGSQDLIYANTAFAVAKRVASGQVDRGILICGTGIGMNITANKVKGAYAALLSDVYSAERAQLSNRVNIACFDAFTMGEKNAIELLKAWLGCSYDQGSLSQPKIQRIKDFEEK